MLYNPELRLKSRSGQDRGDTLARTTDKGFPQGRIYSLISHNNKNEMRAKKMLEGLRVGNSDALEVRVGAYYNYTCNAPGWNLRIALSA